MVSWMRQDGRGETNVSDACMSSTDPTFVIAGFDPASRVYPTCGTRRCGPRASPRSDAIHPFDELKVFSMDARVKPRMTSRGQRPLVSVRCCEEPNEKPRTEWHFKYGKTQSRNEEPDEARVRTPSGSIGLRKLVLRFVSGRPAGRPGRLYRGLAAADRASVGRRPAAADRASAGRRPAVDQA
jgi:hypothetical protein